MKVTLEWQISMTVPVGLFGSACVHTYELQMASSEHQVVYYCVVNQTASTVQENRKPLSEETPFTQE